MIRIDSRSWRRGIALRARTTAEGPRSGEHKTAGPLLALATLLGALGAQPPAPSEPPLPAPFRVTVERVLGPETVLLADGRRVRLQGISLPAKAVRPPTAGARLETELRRRVQGKAVWVTAEPANALEWQ